MTIYLVIVRTQIFLNMPNEIVKRRYFVTDCTLSHIHNIEPSNIYSAFQKQMESPKNE